MRNSSVCVGWSGYVVLVLSLLLPSGCESIRSGVIPSHGTPEAQARVVSSVVRAGPLEYVVDEIQTPTQDNLEGIAPGPSGNIWFTGYALVGRSSITSDMTEFPLSEYQSVSSITE